MPTPTALVTGADRGLGLALTARLAGMGWQVYAGSYLPDWPELAELAKTRPERIVTVPLDVADAHSVEEARDAVRSRTGRLDLILNNAGVSTRLKDNRIRAGQNYDDLIRLYRVNALGALRVTEAFLPLMADSAHKRLAFVSSEAGSVEACRREAWYGYCMSKAALNEGVSRLFRRIRPEGYRFRLYHPGWVKSYMSGTLNRNADLEPDEAAARALAYFLRDLEDEDRLVMRDGEGGEWPW
jgi:NAD(P)-dependent dehydrogenase (short-subunit alcohol dehydrogenase family)